VRRLPGTLVGRAVEIVREMKKGRVSRYVFSGQVHGKAPGPPEAHARRRVSGEGRLRPATSVQPSGPGLRRWRRSPTPWSSTRWATK
jgi:hypothetical protein